MPSSDYYWTRHLIQGFGKMWFLNVPQEADSPGGGESLLGSVVNELRGGLFSSMGLIGKDFPEPNHLTTPQLLLKKIEEHRSQLGISNQDSLVQTVNYPSLRLQVEKKNSLKLGVGDFPSIPVSLSIDHSRMVNITVEFGANTRRNFIPTDYLGRLKRFFDGDDRKVDPGSSINIDKETIVHQILLTDQYSVLFESEEEFDGRFEAAIAQANQQNVGKIKFELDQTTKKRVVVKVDDGKDYLLALKDIDWDDF